MQSGLHPPERGESLPNDERGSLRFLLSRGYLGAGVIAFLLASFLLLRPPPSALVWRFAFAGFVVIAVVPGVGAWMFDHYWTVREVEIGSRGVGVATRARSRFYRWSDLKPEVLVPRQPAVGYAGFRSNIPGDSAPWWVSRRITRAMLARPECAAFVVPDWMREELLSRGDRLMIGSSR